MNLSSVFFLEASLGLAFLAFITLRLSFLYRLRLAFKKQIRRHIRSEPPFFYSSYYIKQEVLKKFFHLPLSTTERLAVAAIKNNQTAPIKIQKALTACPRDYRLLLLAAETAYLADKKATFKAAIEQIRLPLLAPQALKADYLRLSALNDLYTTDMLSASEACSKALKIYQKLKYSYEEAQCYLLLAQIYRISGIYDVAFSMLKEAEKLFLNLGLTAKTAEVKAYFGLLELGRENYSPAEAYLTSAQELCLKKKLTKTGADIKNWQGLVAYLQNKDTSAAAAFSAVTKAPAARPQAKAFAAEMSARLFLKKQQPDLALKAADTALALHQQNAHRPGIFENLYLKAQIYYYTENYTESEKILTALIKEKTPANTIYYPANAYTLLGLINLRQKRLNIAQTLFKQALDLENSQNRIRGAAIDYNNLAETALQKGDKASAETYLKQALIYAQTLEDKELENYLKAKLCL